MGVCEGIFKGIRDVKLNTRQCDLASAPGIPPGEVTVGYKTGTTFIVEEIRLEWLPQALPTTTGSYNNIYCLRRILLDT